LIKQACGIAKASGNTPKEKAGQITKAKIEEIAKLKLPDTNTAELASAISMVEGTARSMGIDVVEQLDAPKVDA